MLVNTKRIIRLGFINFWRNGLVSLASLIVMVITLLVIGGSVLSRAFLLASLDEIKSKVDISVAFHETVDEEEVLGLKQDLSLLPEVTNITYSSREQELAEFRERNKDNALLLQSLEEVDNPFGARLNIRASDPNRYESIVKFLQDKDATAGEQGIIYDISFKKDVVDKLSRLIDTAERAGLTIILVLVFSSVIVTFATVSLAIYVSREEIGVMRLVGARDQYIRGPFLVEGAIIGLLAAVLALILLYPATIWIHQVTAGLLVGINLLSYYLNNFGHILLILLGSGIILGVISSGLALRRHLKV